MTDVAGSLHTLNLEASPIPQLTEQEVQLPQVVQAVNINLLRKGHVSFNKKFSLPGHDWVLHSTASWLLPGSQWLSGRLSDVSGSWHCLVLDLTPVSQVFEQALQLAQVVQAGICI